MTTPEISYAVADEADTLDAMGDHDSAAETRRFSEWNLVPDAVVRYENGVPAKIIGTDGGEPEDQTLGRNWSWVAPALQAAYRLGHRHGWETKASD